MIFGENLEKKQKENFVQQTYIFDRWNIMKRMLISPSLLFHLRQRNIKI